MKTNVSLATKMISAESNARYVLEQCPRSTQQGTDCDVAVFIRLEMGCRESDSRPIKDAKGSGTALECAKLGQALSARLRT